MRYLISILGLFFSPLSWSALEVVTTTPDLAWAIERIGGEHVKVDSLLRGSEDPHYVDAVPSFIHKVRSADLLCAVGLDLESGWLPKVRSRAGARNKAYCEFGQGIQALDIPHGEIDRSMGDVHASGNPHFHLSPQHFGQGAKEALTQLKKLAPQQAEQFQKNYEKLLSELDKTHKEIKERLKTLQDLSFLQYHKEYTYYFSAYGLKSSGALEDIPGVPPSASRLGEMALTVKKQNIVAILAARHSPAQTLERFHDLSKIPVIKLPLGMIKGEHESYFNLQNQLANEILKHVKK